MEQECDHRRTFWLNRVSKILCRKIRSVWRWAKVVVIAERREQEKSEDEQVEVRRPASRRLSLSLGQISTRPDPNNTSYIIYPSFHPFIYVSTNHSSIEVHNTDSASHRRSHQAHLPRCNTPPPPPIPPQTIKPGTNLLISSKPPPSNTFHSLSTVSVTTRIPSFPLILLPHLSLPIANIISSSFSVHPSSPPVFPVQESSLEHTSPRL